jgi:flagellar protein FlbD
VITLHRLNRQEFVLNAELIETLESTPDTLITLTDGKKLLVPDAIGDIVAAVVNYRRLCNGTLRIVTEEKTVLPSDSASMAADAPLE